MTGKGTFAVVFDVLDHDVETLVRALTRSRHLLLVADARSPRVEELQRDVDADLIVASHRLIDSGAGLRHSDFDLASQVAAAHSRVPLEAIVYATDALIDLGWYEVALANVPRGRLLKGALASSNELLDDLHSFADWGPTVMALWGDAAISDFAIKSRPSVGLPNWLDVPQVTPTISEWRTELSTVLDGRGLAIGDLLTETKQAVAHTEGMTFALVSDRQQESNLSRALPDGVTGRVLLGTPSDSWIAELVGRGGLVAVDSLTQSLADFEPARREPTPSTSAIVNDMDVLGELLDRMIYRGGPDSLIVAAQNEMLAKAIEGTRTLFADLGFMAAHRVPMGDLDPGHLRDDVVSIGPRARRAARAAAEASPDFRTFVFRLTEPGLISSAVVGLVPNMDGPHPASLRTTRSPLDLGLRLAPPLLPMPNTPAEQHPPALEVFDPKSWVGRLSWGTRSRLALPWRWGLLPRAMKGRW